MKIPAVAPRPIQRAFSWRPISGRSAPRVLAALALLALAAASSPASAELTQRGDLFVRFEGGISPRTLPRHVPAPIAVHFTATIRSLSGEVPPPLKDITIALNRAGQLDTRGLPVCRRAEITPSSTQEALVKCGPALVGLGGYVSKTTFPEQKTFPSRGQILAFNGRSDGRPAIIAYVYGSKPAPTAQVLVFHLRRSSGTYGTTLTISLPSAVNRWGYLKRIYLSLGRLFAYRGHQRSYLSAVCGAPAGFHVGVFPFVRATASFEDGRTLSSTLTRSCRVGAAVGGGFAGVTTGLGANHPVTSANARNLQSRRRVLRPGRQPQPTIPRQVTQ